MTIAQDLYLYWQTVPNGVGVTLDEMMDAVNAFDGQQIRSALTALRKGEVGDGAGGRFPRLPVRYSSVHQQYFHLGHLTADAVAAQVPGEVMAREFAQLLTRVMTLGSALGRDGIVNSAALLGEPDIMAMIRQFDVDIVHQVEDQVREIGRARLLLELRGGGDPPAALPPAPGDGDEEDEE